MKKAELIHTISTKAELTKQDSKKAIDLLFETISNTLAKEEKIQVVGFGKFEVRNRAERHSQTGQELIERERGDKNVLTNWNYKFFYR
ncbi:DNA-binding protein [Priestia megaterium]|uniref:HU family DNA-binding protein n=1 Tax=Priestia megaterium TaxID=1404 RepID=UPI000BF49E96|nr:HU family DNA-binding protein [Priestia megaterium]PFI60723.1 DNA-binding protein [Priestia megaterium]